MSHEIHEPAPVGGNESGEPDSFLDLSKWTDCEAPERRWLVQNLIPFGCVTALYGDGGSGKTMLALDLMVAMADHTLQAWLGIGPRGIKSVGLFAEDDEFELIRRVQRLSDARQVGFERVARSINVIAAGAFDATLAAPDGDRLTWAPLFDVLLARIDREKASLLVLDYAAAVFGGNELDRQQVSEFIRSLNAVAALHGIAILLLGHPSMDGMRAGRGTSGSTAWRNQVRSFLHLAVDDRQGDPQGRTLVTLRHTKSNYGPWGQSFRIASDGSRFEILDVMERETRKARKLSEAQAAVFRALCEAVRASGETRTLSDGTGPTAVASLAAWKASALKRGIGGSASYDTQKRVLNRAISSLRENGLVEIDGDWAWPTQPGQ